MIILSPRKWRGKTKKRKLWNPERKVENSETDIVRKSLVPSNRRSSPPPKSFLFRWINPSSLSLSLSYSTCVYRHRRDEVLIGERSNRRRLIRDVGCLSEWWEQSGASEPYQCTLTCTTLLRSMAMLTGSALAYTTPVYKVQALSLCGKPFLELICPWKTL
jgi:hypothetical protein